jgi:hypothetical protein
MPNQASVQPHRFGVAHQHPFQNLFLKACEVPVANVQFNVDGTNIGLAVTSSPYSITWNSTTVADGSHTLYAIAQDTSGNYSTSSIGIAVKNTPELTPAFNSPFGMLH